MKAITSSQSINSIARLLLSLAVLFGSAATTHSATRTWTGGGTSAYWGASANWNTGEPVAGDDLVFPVVAVRRTNTNDLGNVTFRSITISGSGYVLRGTPGGATISLTHGIDSSAAYEFENTVELNIDLAADQSFSSDDPFGPLYMAGNVDIGNHTLEILGDGMMSFTGVISGSGGLTKNSSSLTYLGGSSDNTFSGATVVNSGVLKLSKPSGSAIKYGQLTIGDGVGINDTAIVRELYNYQIGNGPITINEDGWLDVDDYTDTVGAITFNGGHAGSSGTGMLRLGGTVTVNAATEEALLDGNVYMGSGIRTFDVGRGSSGVIGHDLRVNAILSGGGLRKTGAGDMMLNSVGVNIYTGTTTVEQGGFIAWVDSAFGDTGSGTVVGGSGSIYLVGVNVGTESLTLGRTDSGYVLRTHTTCSWAGPVTLAEDALILLDTSGPMEFSGAISGPGGIILEGTLGNLIFSGSSPNTYAGDTHVLGGTLYLDKEGPLNGALSGPGDLYVGDGVSAWDSIVVQWLRDFQINATVDINVVPSGKVYLNDHTDFVGNLNLTSAGIETGSGTMGLYGDITATVVTNRNAFVSGNMALMPGTRTLHVIDNATLSLSAQVSGSGSLLKTGDGDLSLYSSNTFAGATTVAEGVLFIANDHAMGDTAAGTVVQDGAYIRLGDARVPEEPLTLYGDGTGYGALLHYGLGATNSWAGSITLASDAAIGVPQNASNIMDLSGIIGGPGSLTKKGAGTLMLTGVGDNIHGGNTIVEEGMLVLDQVSGNSIPHDLIIEDGATVRQESNFKIVGDVRIYGSGIYDMNGYSETIEDLILNDGADFDSGSGTLTILGDVTVDGGTSSISGKLGLFSGNRDFNILFDGMIIWPGAHCYLNADVGGIGNLIKKGPGKMRISGNNTYSGTTIVEEGDIMIESDTALGSSVAGTSVNAGSRLYLSVFNPASPVHVSGETLSLGGDIRSYGLSSSWTGAITLTGDVEIGVTSGNYLDLAANISGVGGVTKKWPGTLVYSGASANTYAGDTIVEEGTLELDKTGYEGAIPAQLVIGDGLGGANADVVRLKRTNQIKNQADMTIASSGLFDLDGLFERIDAVTGSGSVELDVGYLIAGNNGSSFTFDGMVSGSGYLWKVGSGVWTLTANNTYSGTTRIETGTLIVNGSQSSSDVTVNSSGTLGGTGTVGAINSDGTVAPGASAGQLGSGTVTMNAGSTFEVELDGYTSTGYDRLNVIGTVSLANNPQLAVSLGYMPAVDDKFTIINNDGIDAVKGTFKGLPDGASLTVGNATLRINYGFLKLNDVFLTVTGVTALEPLAITSIGTDGVDVDLEWVGGVPFYVVEKKTALTNAIWTAVSAQTRDMAASLPADTTNGFYRVKGGN